MTSLFDPRLVFLFFDVNCPDPIASSCRGKFNCYTKRKNRHSRNEALAARQRHSGKTMDAGPAKTVIPEGILSGIQQSL